MCKTLLRWRRRWVHLVRVQLVVHRGPDCHRLRWRRIQVHLERVQLVVHLGPDCHRLQMEKKTSTSGEGSISSALRSRLSQATDLSNLPPAHQHGTHDNGYSTLDCSVLDLTVCRSDNALKRGYPAQLDGHTDSRESNKETEVSQGSQSAVSGADAATPSSPGTPVSPSLVSSTSNTDQGNSTQALLAKLNISTTRSSIHELSMVTLSEHPITLQLFWSLLIVTVTALMYR